MNEKFMELQKNIQELKSIREEKKQLEEKRRTLLSLKSEYEHNQELIRTYEQALDAKKQALEFCEQNISMSGEIKGYKGALKVLKGNDNAVLPFKSTDELWDTILTDLHGG